MLAVLLVELILAIRVKLYFYLTVWGVHLTFLSCVLISILAYCDRNTISFRGYKYFWRFTLVLFEIMMSTNVVITIVFWVFLFPEVDMSMYSFAGKLDMVWTHCVPCVVTLIEYSMNAWRFKNSHWVVLLIFGLVYGLVNLIGTLIYGPIYPIITWKDFMSYIFILVICLMEVGLHFLFSKISHWRNRSMNGSSIIYMDTHRDKVDSKGDMYINSKEDDL